MSKKYKKYDPKVKAKVAISAVQGKKTDIEICSQFDIPKANMYEWKNKLITEPESLFIPESAKNKENKKLRQEIENLQKIIGEITIENCFLKKKLKS